MVKDERFEQRCIEEYRALRAESLRCAGIIANAVWIGITQFAITVAAGANFAKESSEFRVIFLVLLTLESLAATSMYLSELYKYVRIGRYIREKIEKQYAVQDFFDFDKNPMSWENWLNSETHQGQKYSHTFQSLYFKYRL